MMACDECRLSDSVEQNTFLRRRSTTPGVPVPTSQTSQCQYRSAEMADADEMERHVIQYLEPTRRPVRELEGVTVIAPTHEALQTRIPFVDRGDTPRSKASRSTASSWASFFSANLTQGFSSRSASVAPESCYSDYSFVSDDSQLSVGSQRSVRSSLRSFYTTRAGIDPGAETVSDDDTDHLGLPV